MVVSDDGGSTAVSIITREQNRHCTSRISVCPNVRRSEDDEWKIGGCVLFSLSSWMIAVITVLCIAIRTSEC